MHVAHTGLGSFDGHARSGSFTSQPPAPQQMMYAPPPHSMMGHHPGAYRPFPEPNGYAHPMEKPQIYTAVYSGVQVYEMEVNGVAVMRRRSDSWLNATQILKVAGVDKGKRTKVLEKEILTGEHEKVQGGYGKYQGTWINYRRGREFCRQYGVEDILRPLLEYDMSADGSGQPGQGIDTPTKEQAMAANRKRFYTQALDARAGNPGASGTFFSNISSTASNAIAAMNKVARMNSPAPRPGSAQRRPATMGGPRPSVPPMASQDSFRHGSQHSISMTSERSFSGQGDSAYGSAPFNGEHHMEMAEPPRKRMRPSQDEPTFSQPNGFDVSMRDGTPTEPNESFVYQQAGAQLPASDGDYPTALPPLPPPGDRDAEEKQLMLTDLFADQSRTDFSNHPAIIHLSGADLDMPIDNTANTALHWAATLARVSLMRLLVSKGANMFRGNAAGQTPLMSAVSVNNSLDHSCFPETLEILSPLIELRDAQGRTILHHIAVTCAIKGRAASSKYYLEALLEFLVRGNGSMSSQSSSYDGVGTKPMGLMRFMSEMVNARDKAGNTALNLAARIGNRSIIQQLLEVQADPLIPNYKGMRPVDFGVGTDDRNGANVPPLPMSQMSSPNKTKTPSKVDETGRELIPLINSILTTATSQHLAESRLKQEATDAHNAAIRQLSAQQAELSARLSALQSRVRSRQQTAHRAANLRTWLDVQRRALALTDPNLPSLAPSTRIGAADAALGLHLADDHIPPPLREMVTHFLTQNPGSRTNAAHLLQHLGASSASADPRQWPPELQRLVASLPSATAGGSGETPPLRRVLNAYDANNQALRERRRRLKERDGELEGLYRKVVSLCTGVEEERVEGLLGQLVAAVESEGGGAAGGAGGLSGGGVGAGGNGAGPGGNAGAGGNGAGGTAETGRVREFLRKVEGVGVNVGVGRGTAAAAGEGVGAAA